MRIPLEITTEAICFCFDGEIIIFEGFSALAFFWPFFFFLSLGIDLEDSRLIDPLPLSRSSHLYISTLLKHSNSHLSTQLYTYYHYYSYSHSYYTHFSYSTPPPACSSPLQWLLHIIHLIFILFTIGSHRPNSKIHRSTVIPKSSTSVLRLQLFFSIPANNLPHSFYPFVHV